MVTPTPQDVAALRHHFERMAGAWMRGRWNASIGVDDLVQIALIEALQWAPSFVDTGKATFATAVDKRVRGAWSEAIAGSHFGPTAGTRYNMRKRGQAVDYGEVSYDALPGEWLANVAVEGAEPLSYLHITPAEAAIVIADIDRELAREVPKYISRNSTRMHYAKGAYYVFAKVLGKEQFVGTAATMEEGVEAQKTFLRSLREWCVAAIEEEDMQ